MKYYANIKMQVVEQYLLIYPKVHELSSRDNFQYVGVHSAGRFYTHAFFPPNEIIICDFVAWPHPQSPKPPGKFGLQKHSVGVIESKG